MTPIAIPTTVRIFTQDGSFEAPRQAYDEARKMAQLSRKLWWVGLLPGEGCKVAPTRQILIESGCKILGFVLPGDRRCA